MKKLINTPATALDEFMRGFARANSSLVTLHSDPDHLRLFIMNGVRDDEYRTLFILRTRKDS